MKNDIYSLYLDSPRLKPATSFLLFMVLIYILCFYIFPTALNVFMVAVFPSVDEIPLYLYAFYASAKLSAAYCLAVICQAACFNHERFGGQRCFPSKLERVLMGTGKNFAAGFLVYFLLFPFCFSLLFIILRVGCDGFDYFKISLNFNGSVGGERVVDFLLYALPNISDFNSAHYWAAVALSFFLGLFFYLVVLAFFYGKRPSYFIIRPIQKYIWNICGEGAIKPLPGGDV